MREFACQHEITNYFDVGDMGIEHALLPEKGLTVAGDVIIGADSTPVPTGLWGLFPPGWEVRIWPLVWLLERHGLRCRPPSSSI